MKQRFTNWITTAIGAVIMIGAIGIYFGFIELERETTTLELGMLVALGWVFLTAKDTLIEGLFLNLFKIGKKETKD